LSSAGVGPDDVPILIFIKAFYLAVSGDGLGYTPTNALKFVQEFFALVHGYQMLLTWVTTDGDDQVHSHFTAKEAIDDANTNLGYTLNPNDPVAGFCAVGPAAAPAATP